MRKRRPTTGAPSPMPYWTPRQPRVRWKNDRWRVRTRPTPTVPVENQSPAQAINAVGTVAGQQTAIAPCPPFPSVTVDERSEVQEKPRVDGVARKRPIADATR